MSAFVTFPLQPNLTPKSSNKLNKKVCIHASFSKSIAESFQNQKQPLHPVLDIIKQRSQTGSKPKQRKDDRKLALCIEGGGMRGAVSAGMVAALKYCGLENTFDVVYGCSAGAIVGAYFTSRQLPIYGAQIYYDTICSIPENGQRFIDLWALRHHPYFGISRKKRSQYYSKGARPVLLLDRLIDTVMRHEKPLDWNAFQKVHELQPLKPVASSLNQMESKVLDSFSTRDQLLECLRASARVPGIAGNPVEINGDFYTDGLLFEPIPYRSAIEQGCTDILVLRTRDNDACDKSSKPGIYEKHIASPYFDLFPSFAPRAQASDYLMSGQHISIYTEDVKFLQQENENPRSNGKTAVFSILPPCDVPVVGQLESRAKYVYEGVRNGFAAAYDTLSPFAVPHLRPTFTEKEKNGKQYERDRPQTSGKKVASWVFSDEELYEVEKRHQAARRKSNDKKEPTRTKVVPRKERRRWLGRKNRREQTKPARTTDPRTLSPRFQR